MSPDDRKYCLYRLQHGAYWFSFAPTGQPHVDLLLGAICAAGKRAHSTEHWNENWGDDEAATPLQVIQDAADEAAGRIAELERAIREAPCGFDGHSIDCGNDCDCWKRQALG